LLVESVKDELRQEMDLEAVPFVNGRIGGRRGMKDGELTIRLTAEDSTVTLELSGAIDLANASTLDNELRSTEKYMAPRLIRVNLAGLEFIDTTGLSKLITAANRAFRGGWSFQLGGAQGQVARALEITGLSERFDKLR
jgi:anti-sigma B factor antagonist